MTTKELTDLIGARTGVRPHRRLLYGWAKRGRIPQPTPVGTGHELVWSEDTVEACLAWLTVRSATYPRGRTGRLSTKQRLEAKLALAEGRQAEAERKLGDLQREYETALEFTAKATHRVSEADRGQAVAERRLRYVTAWLFSMRLSLDPIGREKKTLGEAPLASLQYVLDHYEFEVRETGSTLQVESAPRPSLVAPPSVPKLAKEVGL